MLARLSKILCLRRRVFVFCLLFFWRGARFRVQDSGPRRFVQGLPLCFVFVLAYCIVLCLCLVYVVCLVWLVVTLFVVVCLCVYRDVRALQI